MKITPLVYYFTGTWAFTPSIVEIKDNAFCKNLFGKPSITTSGTGANGFFVTSSQIGLLGAIDLLVITPQQIQLITNNLSSMSGILEKVAGKLSELNMAPFSFSFMSNTIAIDCEVAEIKTKNASKWLSEKFIEKNLTVIDELKSAKISTIDILFSFEKSATQKISFQIQPRTNKDDCLFIKTTEENNIKTENEFYKHIAKSYDHLYDQISKQSEKLVPNG